MKRRLFVIGAVLCATIAPGLPLHAQGSLVFSHSACMTGRNGAGIARPCQDGSAVFFNPAGIALQQSAIGLGITAVYNERTFTYDTTGEEISTSGTIPVPHVYAQLRLPYLDNRLAVGIGAWAPYGLTTEWPESFEGRFVGYDNTLRGVYIQPTAAYQIVPGRVALGVGWDIVLGSVEINQRLDAADQPSLAELGIPRGTDLADVRLKGDDVSYTGHIALLARLTDRLSFGARYLHEAEIVINDGEATFSPVTPGPTLLLPLGPGGQLVPVSLETLTAEQFAEGGPLTTQNVATKLTLPAHAVVGLAYEVTPRLNVMGDFMWTQWSVFDEFALSFENAALGEDTLYLDYEDAYTYRFGLDYAATPNLDLRAGFIYNTAATPDETVTPLLPENERNYLSAGLGYRFAPGFQADAYFQWVNQADRRGRVRGRESRTQTAADLNTGVYQTTAFLYGVTFSYRFGAPRP